MKIVDMHCDTITCLLNDVNKKRNVSLFKNRYHVDIEKMRKGNYAMQNFAIFTNLLKDDVWMHPQAAIDLYYQELAKNKDYIRPVYAYNDIEANRKQGYISAMLTLEEGDVVQGDLAILRNYYRLGVRMITLTWNYPNKIASPNIDMSKKVEYKDLFSFNKKDGLTTFGIAFAQEMERLGIIIDVSHLSDAGVEDVFKYTSKPFVASHSNARSICGVSRNLSDEMIQAMAKRGCVIGVNYCGDFLVESKEGNAKSTINDIVKHIQHLYKVGGIDCIGLGSDFDGINSNLEIEDASQIQKLCTALQKAGFSEDEIAKICYKNVLRLYQEIL